MIYLVYGDQIPIINQRCRIITKEFLGEEKDEMNYVRFDARETLIQEIISECNYLPLGYDKKLIVANNAYFLSSKKEKNKIESEQDYQSLIEYLNNPSEETCLILTVETSELDSKSKIVSLLKEKAEIYVAKMSDKETFQGQMRKYIVNNLGVEIDNDALAELIQRCEDDVMLTQNNAKKLSLYTKHIKYDDVCLFVPRPLEDNTFALYNYLISNRNDEAIKLYRDLLAANIEPVTLIGTLAKQFRFLYQVGYLLKNGNSIDEAAAILNVKPIRVSIARKQIYSVSENTILKTLDDLFNLDYNIKSGFVDRFYAFELFLINFKAE